MTEIKCKDCGSIIPEQYSEMCRRGRWMRKYYRCPMCELMGNIKVKQIPNNVKKGVVQSKPVVQWGKNKSSRRNPKKK